VTKPAWTEARKAAQAAIAVIASGAPQRPAGLRAAR